jgi:serine/threonine protein kinase
LKPENILIDADGHIKLCDFGFAMQLDSAKSSLSDGCGSAMYVAPGEETILRGRDTCCIVTYKTKKQ